MGIRVLDPIERIAQSAPPAAPAGGPKRALGCTVMAKLTIVQSANLALREVSGLCVRRGDRGPEILAIGDEDFTVMVLAVEGGALGERVRRVDLRSLCAGVCNKRGGSQWEAVAADADGQALVLQENPGTVFVFSPTFDALSTTVALEARNSALARRWEDDENSRGEGVVALSNGHLLIVKEKRPALLIEFGPRGAAAGGVRPELLVPAPFAPDADRFVPLAAWSIDDGPEDLSDAAVSPTGQLYVVSDAERCLLQLGTEMRPEAGAIRPSARWELPKKIKKPEGLAFLPDGSPVVACDRDDDGTALFVLESIGA